MGLAKKIRVRNRRQLLCKHTQEEIVYTFSLAGEVKKVWLEVKRCAGDEAHGWHDFDGVECEADENRVSLILSDEMPQGRYTIGIYCIMADLLRHKVSVVVLVQDEFLNKIL